jgi:hypothetical protein
LLGKLVPALLKGLEETPVVRKVSGSSANAVQRFSQAAAVEALRVQKPVSQRAPQAQSKTDHAVLLTGITVRRGERLTSLDLKADDVLMQTMSFDEEALRQWLGIVYSQYKIAKWSDGIWPCWIEPRQDRGTVALLN